MLLVKRKWASSGLDQATPLEMVQNFHQMENGNDNSTVLAYNNSIMIISLYNRTSGVQMLVCTIIDKSYVFSATSMTIRTLSHCQSATKGHYKANHKTNSLLTRKLHCSIFSLLQEWFYFKFQFQLIPTCLKAQWFTQVQYVCFSLITITSLIQCIGVMVCIGSQGKINTQYVPNCTLQVT